MEVCSQSEEFMDILMDKLCRQMASKQLPVGSARRASVTKIKTVMEQNHDLVIEPLQSET